jgi:GT2 family glycosyltransferase
MGASSHLTPAPFTIVVVTWNSAGELPGLITSIDEHLHAEHELLFVDNASSDDTVADIRRLAPHATVVELDRNTDFSGGNNIGVRKARHETVVMLNADTILLDNSLAALAELAAETRALCAPRLLNDDLTPQRNAHAPVAGWEQLLTAFWPTFAMPPALAARCDPWRVDRRTEAGWVTAACLAAPRDLLIDLGPFDEYFPFHGDDIDLAIRARRAGVKSLFAPDLCSIVHLGNKAVDRRWDDRGVRNAVRARSRVARRNFPAWRAAYDQAVQLLTHATRWWMKAALRRPDAAHDRAFVRAIVGGSRSE